MARESRIRRAELFDNLAQLVKHDADELAKLMARECGKVVTECKAEVIEGLHMIKYVFGAAASDRPRAKAPAFSRSSAFLLDLNRNDDLDTTQSPIHT